jgi:hypothetical protein
VATICDIDDTLLINGNQPIQRTIEYLKSLPGALILVTGRNESQRSETIKALRSAGIKYSRLIMNPGPSSETADFKYKVGLKLKRSVNLAIDNNPTMRAAYKKAGIPTKDPAYLPDPKKFWHLI